MNKFKNQEALQKAYESLEKEFTKRSQRLKELQKNNDDLVEDLANMTIYPEEAVKRIRQQAEKDTAKEIFARFKNRTHQGVDGGGFFVEITLRMEDLIWVKNRYGVEV